MNNASKQVAMHTDFFDRTMSAIENGFYLEAIFREYATIESRLEVLQGLLGAPCSKTAEPNLRKAMKISHRIHCLKKIYCTSEYTTVLGKTKLDSAFFNKLEAWIGKRNTIVHGFYKDELKYEKRSNTNHELADSGLICARLLYNEAKRLRRFEKHHPETDWMEIMRCRETSCIAFIVK